MFPQVPLFNCTEFCMLSLMSVCLVPLKPSLVLRHQSLALPPGMVLFHQETLRTFLLSTSSGCFMDSLGSTDHSQITPPSFCVFEDYLDRREGSFLSHGFLSLPKPLLGDLAERVWESPWVLLDGSPHPHAYLPFQRILC